MKSKDYKIIENLLNNELVCLEKIKTELGIIQDCIQEFLYKSNRFAENISDIVKNGLYQIVDKEGKKIQEELQLFVKSLNLKDYSNSIDKIYDNINSITQKMNIGIKDKRSILLTDLSAISNIKEILGNQYSIIRILRQNGINNMSQVILFNKELYKIQGIAEERFNKIIILLKHFGFNMGTNLNEYFLQNELFRLRREVLKYKTKGG